MTPEERRHTAFEAFDELLVETDDIDEALADAAAEGGLRTDVFRQIATTAFGDLTAHRQQVRLRKQNALEHGRFLQKLSEYVDKFHVRHPEGQIPPAPEWVRNELGRELSPEEDRVARDRHVAALNLSMKRDLDAILKDIDDA